jgi:hypothetical protein
MRIHSDALYLALILGGSALGGAVLGAALAFYLGGSL